MERLLLFASPSPPLLSPSSRLPLRRSPPAKLGYKGSAFPAAPAAAAARRRMVVVAVARPEKEELLPEVEEDEKPEQEEVERLTAEELEKIEAAVMEGKDEGRAPLDYDRRAKIFHESSRAFRDANKDY